MIRKLTFLYVFLALANFTFPQASWNSITSLPLSADVISISVVDANVVFVVTPGNGVFRTLDGGQTWEIKNTGIPAGYGVYGVSATDSLNCIVGWLNTAQSSASIYRTLDGGKSWTSVWTLAGSFPDGIKMFSPSYGIFIGDPTGSGQPYQFRYTNDSGKTWNLSPTAPIATSEFGVINAFDFIDTSRIWVGSANTLATGTTAKIYKTTTGINGTWSSASVSGTKGAQGLYFQAVAFVDTIHGMAGSNNGNIVKTTDGGTTWTAVTIPTGVTSLAVLNMTALRDGSNTIWMSINEGAGVYNLYFTKDFGTTWTSITTPADILSNGMAHIQFLSPTLGYAGGIGGVMYKYSVPATAVNDKNIMPADYNVSQNFPNPFNPSTSIKYQVPGNVFVSLKVYNSLGQDVATLVNGMVTAGSHEVNFNASNLSSGIYFYVLKAGEKFVQTRKMILLK